MAKLKPWFHVIHPREDLREGRPLDASEFAVHLDHVRENRAPKDYQDPERFFERTYLTRNLKTSPPRRSDGSPGSRRDLGRLQHGHPVRRRQDALADAALPPGQAGTGGAGLAGGRGDPGTGPGQGGAQGRDGGLRRDRVRLDSPAAAASGEPLRKTPWGEIAWQLGGREGVRGGRPSTTRRGSPRAAT